MSEGITSNQPKGVLRYLFRLPIWLYRANLGWLMGKRFLMLTHTGRKSGQPRQVVVEVVAYESSSGAYYVAAGWRSKADWFKNIQANSSVRVTVGTQTFDATSQVIGLSEAAATFLVYASRHPLAFRELSRMMMGVALRPNLEGCYRLAQSVPLVELMPTQPSTSK